MNLEAEPFAERVCGSDTASLAQTGWNRRTLQHSSETISRQTMQVPIRGAVLIDNFESDGLQPLKWADVVQFLPKEGVDFIVTSRSGEIPVVSIQMPNLDRKDSTQLLMKMMKQNDEKASDEAAKFCDDCPLALTLFAGFCDELHSVTGGLQYLRDRGGRNKSRGSKPVIS